MRRISSSRMPLLRMVSFIDTQFERAGRGQADKSPDQESKVEESYSVLARQSIETNWPSGRFALLTRTILESATSYQDKAVIQKQCISILRCTVRFSERPIPQLNVIEQLRKILSTQSIRLHITREFPYKIQFQITPQTDEYRNQNPHISQGYGSVRNQFHFQIQDVRKHPSVEYNAIY